MEKLGDVTEEQVKFAVDALITLVVEELTRDSVLAPSEVLKDFLTSKTGALLYDESSKLWWTGPSYIADMYRKECKESTAAAAGSGAAEQSAK